MPFCFVMFLLALFFLPDICKPGSASYQPFFGLRRLLWFLVFGEFLHSAYFLSLFSFTGLVRSPFCFSYPALAIVVLMALPFLRNVFDCFVIFVLVHFVSSFSATSE